MRRLIFIAALSATIVFAKPKPETYKETEDFQYSRSSSDDGSKSGFYGAQRGNMGGNYERAHNMDNLAQHQMSGLVKQVDGELGDGVKTRTGSVYTAANSRGIYGSGNYDLGNLQGRNFAEGTSFGNSQSQSLSALSSQNSRHSGQSYSGLESSAGFSSSRSQDAGYRGYQTSHQGNQRQIDNLQTVDTSHGLGAYEYNTQAGYNRNYQTRYGSHGRSESDQSSTNFQSSNGHDENSQARYITTPVKVVVRPGGRVAIPISAPTYAVSQNTLSEGSDVNSDAEVINQPIPTNKAKHYEASYSYRKQWEKHHSIPGDVSIVVPTENPFPKNSELYEDAQLLQSSNHQLQNTNLQTLHSSNMNSGQRAYVRSGSSRTRFQAGHNTQQGQSGFESQQNQEGFDTQQGHSGLSPQHSQSGSSSLQGQSGSSSLQSQSRVSSLQSQTGLSSLQSQSGSTSQQNLVGFNSHQSQASSATRANSYGHNALSSGSAADLTNAAGDINSKPKSYHSSYSYHKSWERQGDPYIIKPVGPVYDAQTSERLMAATSNNAAYTSRQYGTHSRQAHQSYSADCDDQGHIRVARSSNPDQELEQVQNQWEDLGQQTVSKLENLEDLGQQTQNQWDQLQQLGQETQNQWDNLQQLGQETQNQWDNLQQLGQQTQNQFDNLQQLGQQTQDKWENLEDLGQQTHSDQEQRQNENIEDFSQLSQKQDILTNFEQQSNNENENLENLNQQVQKENPLLNFEQQANSQHESLEDINKTSQKEEVLTNFEQQSSNQNEKLDLFSQHAQNEDSITNFEQQANNQNDPLANWNNNWDQSNKPSNADQQFLPVNEPNNNNQDLFNQNQENNWFHSVASVDQNSDTYDFMKPISPWTDNSDSNIQSQNLFPLTSSNPEYNKLGDQNIEENFWHMNNFNSHSQFYNNFSQSQFSTSDTGNPLQGFWAKIDNIAGEVTATEGKTDMENNYNSNYVPVNTNVDFVNTDIDTVSTEKPSEHHKLFDEQTDGNNISTTVLPILASSDSSTLIEKTTTSIIIHDQQPINTNQNTHSEDIGRGDIEPEGTPLETILGPYTNFQDLESSNHNKEAQKPKEGRDKLVTHLTEQENTNENQLELFSTSQSKETTTKSSVQIITTLKSNFDHPSPNLTILDETNINNNTLRELQEVPDHKILENVEIPEDIQQQNLDQQFEDISQIQNSWSPTTNLTQEYNQQNVEQQFEDISQIQNSWSPTNNLTQEYNQQNVEQQFEDISQIQNSWSPTNSLTQEFSQQNVEQQFEDLAQHESMQNQGFQDFGQHLQSSLPFFKDVQINEAEQENQSQTQVPVLQIPSTNYEHNLQHTPDPKDTTVHPSQVAEPIHVSHNEDVGSKSQNLMDNPDTKPQNIQTVVETIAEKKSFWKSVGNTFTKAKNKVYSWFSSS